MKSLEALENVVKRTAIPYFLGMYGNEDHIKDLKTIKRDLEMVEFLKDNLSVGKLENRYYFCWFSSPKELEKLKQWLEDK